MFPSKIPFHEQPLYEEKEIFGEHTEKFVDISIHRNCHVGMHKHDFYELNIVLSGHGCHYIDEMAIPAVAGDVFIIPIGVDHGYLYGRDFNVAHVLLKSSWVEKHKEKLESIPGFPSFFSIEPYLRQVYERHLFLHLNADLLKRVQGEIEKHHTLSDSRYESYHSFFILYLLSELSLEMQKQTKTSPYTENREILKVLEYIQKHYDEKIKIEDLLKVANMSRPTLHRHFKEITNVSPMQYIMNLRLHAVQEHFEKKEHTESKTQIAQKYGFFDTSHLNKYLHKKDESSP